MTQLKILFHDATGKDNYMTGLNFFYLIQFTFLAQLKAVSCAIPIDVV